MKRSTSRLLSTLLVLCMVLALLPGTVLAAEGKLPAPTNLQWHIGPRKGGNGNVLVDNPGVITYEYPSDFPLIHPNNNNSIAVAYYSVKLYRNDELIYEQSGDHSNYGGPLDRLPIYEFQYAANEWGSGTYYFTVQFLGDGTRFGGEKTAYEDSDIVTSPTWTYVAPSRKIQYTPTSTWNGTVLTWSEIEDDTYFSHVYWDVGYAESAEAKPQPIHAGEHSHSHLSNISESIGVGIMDVAPYASDWTCDVTSSDAASRFFDKKGYYSFRIRAFSNNIEECLNSDWSDWSAPYYYDAGTGQGSSPENPSTPSAPTAYASTQTVELDGKKVEFQMYALKDANGNDTNYIKVRDLAMALKDTKAEFSVDWADGVVKLAAGETYTPNGSENATPFSGNRAYTVPTDPTNVNGAASDLQAILLKDDAGGGFTYYKLRDLGSALGFNVSWSAERGVYIETDKPYTG